MLLDDVGFGASSAFGGAPVGSTRVDATVPRVSSTDETTDLGTDTATGVTDDLDHATTDLTVEVLWVQINLGDAAEDFDHMVTPEERYRIAMSRQ